MTELSKFEFGELMEGQKYERRAPSPPPSWRTWAERAPCAGGGNGGGARSEKKKNKMRKKNMKKKMMS